LAETKTAIRYLVELGLKAKGKWTQTNFSRANGNRYSTGFCWHCSSSRLSIISSCHARAEGEEVGQPCCIFRLNDLAGGTILASAGRFWVVAEAGLTAHQVAQKIGIDGSAGQFAVFSIAGFFGYHRKDLWEWLTINSG
jgi:hypothetical protein